jgi:hypothetical protein
VTVSLPGLLYRWHQQGNEHCDDRDNDKRFYERESILHGVLLSFGIAFIILVFIGVSLAPPSVLILLFEPTGRDYNRGMILVMTRA